MTDTQVGKRLRDDMREVARRERYDNGKNNSVTGNHESPDHLLLLRGG